MSVQPMLASDVVRQATPKGQPCYIKAFIQGESSLLLHGINTPLRLAHFLAQVFHETGGLTVLRENLWYTTPERLFAIFGMGNHSAALTVPESHSLTRNPEALAERVYGLGNLRKAKELGNIRPRDGFLFRGGGILQTTGGCSYRRMSEKCRVDFYTSPELIVSAEHALKPALAEWTLGKLNTYADEDNLRGITRRINGGYNGLAERAAWLARIKSIMHI